MKKTLVVLVLLSIGYAIGQEKQSFMVWKAAGQSDCLTLALGPNTRLEAPMKDGEPDMKNAVLLGAVAKIKTSCGIIEIR